MKHNSLTYYALSFVAVVRAGSFSQAAKINNISKAQLSRDVKTLESLLNIKLLQISSRGITLTEQGQQFFNSFSNIEEQCIEAVAALQNDFSEMQGRLRMTAPIDFGIHFLPSIIDSFAQNYPNINITLTLSNKNENIVEQKYDLAIRIANILTDSNLRVRSILKFKRIICASPAYLEKHATPMHLEELKQHRVITSVNHNTDNLKPQWQFTMDNKKVNYQLQHYMEIDSLYAQLELILLGTGIGRMPNYFVKEQLRKGELVEIFQNMEKPTSHIYVLYPNTTALPQKTRIFIDFIKNALANFA